MRLGIQETLGGFLAMCELVSSTSQDRIDDEATKRDSGWYVAKRSPRPSERAPSKSGE